MFSACGTGERMTRSSLGRVTVNDAVNMSEMAYGQSNSGVVVGAVAAGAVGGIAGALIDSAKNRGFEPEFGQTVNIHDFDLREALRKEFPAALNRRAILSHKVELSRDLTSLSGEEMAAQKNEPRFYLEVTAYGFGAAPFGMTLTPFLYVSAELRRNGETIWADEVKVRKGAVTGGTAEQLRTNPVFVKQAWAAAARDVSEQLAEAFAKEVENK